MGSRRDERRTDLPKQPSVVPDDVFEDDDLTEEDKIELLRRLKDLRKNPGDAVSWEDLYARLKASNRRES